MYEHHKDKIWPGAAWRGEVGRGEAVQGNARKRQMDKLVDRLRGNYRIGPHLPNGEPEFGWRQFEAPPIQHEAADHIATLEAEIERLREALEEIQQWSEAYPESIFTKPDLDKMREVLKAADMPTALDAAHGTWGRHILEGVRRITSAALNPTEEKNDVR